MADGKGIDPNSSLMIAYLNSSKSKSGWEKIDEEIGSFKVIVENEDATEDERIDAKGYETVCKFKILGYLSEGTEEECKAKFALMQEKSIFSKYFEMDDESATYQLVFDRLKEDAESLVEECEGNQTYYHQSALNSALAVLIKLPFFDQSLSQEERKEAVGENCSAYAQRHFGSAQKVAELGAEVGNGRGYVFLESACNNFASNTPYANSLEESHNFAALAEGSVIKSAALGCISSIGTLGLYNKKSGNFHAAGELLKTAADAGLSEFQYEFGVLCFQRGAWKKGERYLREAVENEFDVEGKIKKAISKTETISEQIILEKALDSVLEERESGVGVSIS